jgi:V/A-type H+/Na+-transporting ATPase subunit K
MAKINSSTAKKWIRISMMALFAFMLMATLASITKFFVAHAAEAGSEMPAVKNAEQTAPMNPEVKKWGFLAAAISVGLGSIAGGIAVAYVGSAALGVIAEKPEAAGRALIFVGLAEGIAIYGVIVAILILFAK